MSSARDHLPRPRQSRIISLMGAFLILMLPVSLLCPSLTATDIDHFTGGAAQLDIVLAPPGFNSTVHIPVPIPSTPVRGTLNISTVPSPCPLCPRIDIGGDGSAEWQFNASYGPFGEQTFLANGKPNLTLPVSGPSEALTSTIIPIGAAVNSASINITCAPTDPKMAENIRRNNIVYASDALYDNITGIPANATGVNASVRLEGGKKMVTDQKQEDNATLQVVGYSGGRRSLAQTFTPSVDGELVEVGFHINNITGSPGTLSVEIRSVAANGTPTSERLTTTMTAPQNSVVAGAWNVASFVGLQLQADVKYAMVVYARSAMSGRDSYYGFGSNVSDQYARGAMWEYPGSGNASGTPSEVAGADMAFRLVLKTNATTGEMLDLTVNGDAVSGPDGTGGYWCNFSGPSYSDNSWQFAIANPNDFNLLYLNWTARTWYQRHVNNVTVDVGNDGTVEASCEGILDGTRTLSIPPAALDAALGAAEGSNPDEYNISAATVALDIFAIGYGTLEADTLRIGYDLTFPVPNFKSALMKYLAGRPEGTVDLPVVVTASSAGSLRLSSLAAVVDTPPELIAPVPPLAIPEDGADMRLLDLGAHIRDDMDAILAYSVISGSNSSKVVLGFNGTFLTARAPAANWSGTAEVVIEATDGHGQTVRTNEFTISVEAVNDAPFIFSVPPSRAELGRNFTYQVGAVDAENDTLTFKLDATPSGMAVNDTGAITWVPARAHLDVSSDVAVNVSDGDLSSVQRFKLGVVTNNRLPTLSASVPLNETAWDGKPYYCQFLAQDLDPGERLTFSLDIAPQGMSIDSSTGLITWASPINGDHWVRVNVTDGIDFALFNYTLVTRTNHPPKFTSTPPKQATIGQRYLYQLGATDADAGTYLTYQLVKRPDGMTLEPGGQLMWTPSASQAGRNRVEVTVTDGLDPVTQSFDVQVSAADETNVGIIDPLLLLAVVGIVSAVVVAAAGWFLGKRGRR